MGRRRSLPCGRELAAGAGRCFRGSARCRDGRRRSPRRGASLAGRADALAADDRRRRVVAVPGTPTLDTVVAVVAGLRAGVPVVPVAADAGPMERSHILNDSGASLVIARMPDWPEVGPAACGRCRRPAIAVGWIGARIGDAAPALIMYTSGTTGPPKGAVLSRRAIAADLDGLAEAWAWTADDTLVHGLPLFHVHGLVLGVLGALRVGSRWSTPAGPMPERYRGGRRLAVLRRADRVVADRRRARVPPAPSAARGCWCPAAPPLPVPVFEQIAALTGHRRSSATA